MVTHVHERPDSPPHQRASLFLPQDAEDGLLWADFAQASTVESFCSCWLALQCRLIGSAQSGLIVLAGVGPVSTWPEGRSPLRHLTDTAERIVEERRGMVRSAEEAGATKGRYVIGYPIEASGVIHGAVVLEVASDCEAGLQSAKRQLHWGAAWLEVLFSRETFASEGESRHRMRTLLELLSTFFGHESGYAAAVALTTALAAKLGCDLVGVGFLHHGRHRVYALSHSADFKPRTNLVRGLADAMDEAVDQCETVVYPQPAGSAIVARMHGQLARAMDRGSLCTIPLEAWGTSVGALFLQRSEDRPFDRHTVELCQSLAALAAPVLEMQRREERWLIGKAGYSLRRFAETLVGPGRVEVKLATFASVSFLAFCVFAKGDYRVSAKTVLEPIVQRAATAPFDGYIQRAMVRAGDVVRAGQVLCTLDDRELKLQRMKALSRFEEYQKEYHKAMAEREAAKVEIVTAQIKQVQADIALLDEKLASAVVTAPFDGIVATGDLSQSLGSPVDKGRVLFEIAPLDRYRVVLEVDERDIADVAVGQHGSLVLSAFPKDTIPVTVEQVTPVSTAKEGRNFFRVEAGFEQSHDRLRPGMEGAGKIAIGRRLFIWIWTHQVVDAIRLALWSWLP